LTKIAAATAPVTGFSNRNIAADAGRDRFKNSCLPQSDGK